MHNNEFNKLFNTDILHDYDAVVVGYSGGADSSALLSAVVKLNDANEINIKRITAIHVHHGIRGEEADRDALLTREYADKLGVEYRLFKGDVLAMAKECKMSVEEAGREYREACFAEVVDELEDQGYKTAVALAHHANDQAETVIFRMIRGTGPDGIAGIRPMNIKNGITYVRPLLNAKRDDIMCYVEAHNIPYVTDSTNEHDDYTRNYIRNNIIPELIKVNQSAVSHIAGLAYLAGKEQDYINRQAKEWLDANVVVKEETCIPIDAYLNLDPVLKTYVIRNFIKDRGLKLKDITSDHYDMLSRMGEGVNAVSLPNNAVIYARYGMIYVVKGDINDAYNSFSVTFAEVSREKVLKIGEKTYTKIVDYDKIKSTLVVRHREEGDYIVVDDKGSKKSLSRFFIDSKVPKHIRDSVTVVADGQEIVWVVGYRLNMRYYVSEDTVRYMLLEAEGL